MNTLRLGVNIDHVATLRNARGGSLPDPVRAAHLVAEAGADGITVHLREDRRHINDMDVRRLCKESPLPLNLEIAATQEMLEIATQLSPNAICIVPEKREEITTEGGLDVVAMHDYLADFVTRLKKTDSRVSLFVEADESQIRASHQVGADVIELHTGAYSHKSNDERTHELEKLISGAALAYELGLECHAGHGLTYDLVGPIAAITTLEELNIGHFLIGEAVFVGLEHSVKRMRECMNLARFGEAG